MNELKSITAKILQNYYLEPVTKIEDIKFLFNLTLRPAHPVFMKLKKIKDQYEKYWILQWFKVIIDWKNGRKYKLI